MAIHIHKARAAYRLTTPSCARPIAVCTWRGLRLLFTAHGYAGFKVNALRQRTHANSLHGSTAHDVEQLNATMHTKLAVNSFGECAHRKGR